MFSASVADYTMKKFISDRFCNNIDGSSYKHLHGRLVLNTLKYIWLHVETKTEKYTIFDDNLEGEYKEWHKNGQLYEQCVFVNGDRNGEYRLWYDNGQLSKHCSYQNNKLHGEYKSWYKDDEHYMLWTQCTYIDDKRLKSTCVIV